MQLMTIHILTLAILYTSALGVGEAHVHWQKSRALQQITAAAEMSSHDHSHASSENDNGDYHDCCGVHSHNLLGFGTSTLLTVDPLTHDLPAVPPHTLRSVFPRDIFRPPVAG
jgi:hypothetical protein